MSTIANMTLNKGIIDRSRNKMFYTQMLELMQKDSSICYLTCDGLAEGSKMRRAVAEYPDRIIDVGIAEQNLISIAAGLALSGKRPYVVTMGSFLVLRACEQIHTDVAYNNVPVRLIGVDCGTSSGTGPTHDLICDFAIMNAMPNITVIAPADTGQFLQAVNETITYPKPIYFRMPREEDPAVYTEETTSFSVGKSNVVMDGCDATIIAVGKCVYYGLQASRKLAKENISVRVIDMHTIKPIDQEAIISAAKETGQILTVEDHNIQGGLGTLVSAVIAEAGVSCKLIKLGIPDEFSIFGPRNEIAAYYGFDENGIIRAIRSDFNND